jgi:hypothetical protein
MRIAWKPLLILSWPRLGPIVFSSTLKIGAARAPARSKIDRSLASTTDTPVI